MEHGTLWHTAILFLRSISSRKNVIDILLLLVRNLKASNHYTSMAINRHQSVINGKTLTLIAIWRLYYNIGKQRRHSVGWKLFAVVRADFVDGYYITDNKTKSRASWSWFTTYGIAQRGIQGETLEEANTDSAVNFSSSSKSGLGKSLVLDTLL